MAGKQKIICTLFKCSAILKLNQQRVIDFALETDMPIGSLVGVMYVRNYLNAEGEDSIWIGYGESFTVISLNSSNNNGFRGQLNIDNCDRHGLRWFNAYSKTSSEVSTPISDAIFIVFTFGGRQRNKVFEKNNLNLMGEMVEKRGEINCIECRASLNVPMLSSLQPKLLT